ncbi:MAG: hypothetical protein ACE5J5_05505 [Candidatus Hydrothermarchaeales archaeon]
MGKEHTLFVDGHRVYYNFVKPHMALNGRTPAEKAELDLSLGNDKWLDLMTKAIDYNGEID